MILKTKHFGDLDIPLDIILTFEEGLPGLPDSKRFILLNEEVKEGELSGNLFFWLQSIDDPDIAFVMMDVIKVMPDYNPLVSKEELEKSLGEFDSDSFYVYNIVVIPENIQKLSVNLRAPIVINDKLKKGKQIVSNNEDYSIRYHIFEELNKNVK